MSEAKRPAEPARERLTGELRTAMKARDPTTVATVRSLLSALDNKSAIPLAPRQRIVILFGALMVGLPTLALAAM